MMRAALAFPPTYETTEPGRDAYLHPLQLRPIAQQRNRFWSFHDIPTTVALDGNCFAKSLKGFTSHTNEESFRELLKEFKENHDIDRPSGYADVFHKEFFSPPVHYSINAFLAPAMAGGWQAAIRPGVHRGVYHRYDMRSAYLWAATLGMPDASTYANSVTPWRNKHDGLYRIRLLEPNPSAPFPFNFAHECIASNLEIETYSLRVGEVLDGVTWKRTLSPEPIVSAVRKFSQWKLAARCFWGRWGQSMKMTCHANGKTWTLPNTALNIPWAHAIISRVKMRLWEYSKNSLHVFVDSVITSDKLPCGESIGDWRHEQTYEYGVIVRGPGQYGALGNPMLERMSGVPKDSPRRRNDASVVA